jgi:hypothetical protein
MSATAMKRAKWNTNKRFSVHLSKKETETSTRGRIPLDPLLTVVERDALGAARNEQLRVL